MVVIQVREIKGMDKEDKGKEGRGEDIARQDDDIFKIDEVRIEEMAIDGICGVY